MTEKSLPNGADSPEQASQSTVANSTRLTSRNVVSRILTPVVGAEGVTALKKRNLAVGGILATATGITADMLQIFGNVSLYGLIVSSVASIVFGIIVVKRLRGCAHCILPFTSSVLLSGMFAVLFIGQLLSNSSGKGLLATHIEEVSKFQEDVSNALQGLKTGQVEIKTEMRTGFDALRAGQEEVIKEQVGTIEIQTDIIDEQANRILKLELKIRELEEKISDPVTLSELRSEWVGLANAKNEILQNAMDEFLAGREERARTKIKRFAEDLTSAAHEDEIAAAKVWKQLGSISFLNDTETALHAYRQAANLDPNDPSTRNQLAHLLRRTGKYDEAEREYEIILRNHGATDLRWKAIAFHNLGSINFIRGKIDESENYLRRSLALDQSIDNKYGMANTHNSLGYIELNRGNLNDSERHFKHGLDLMQELGVSSGIARSYGDLGLVEEQRGDLSAAEKYHKSSLSLYEKLGHKTGLARQNTRLGGIEFYRGNYDAAETYFKAAVVFNQKIGDKVQSAAVYNNLGLLEKNRGNLKAAADFYYQSYTINKELKRKDGMGAASGNLGIIAKNIGNFESAEDLYKQALSLFEETGNKRKIASQLTNLGVLEVHRNNLESAEQYHRRSLEVSEEIGHKAGKATSFANLGFVANLRDDTNAACEYWSKAENLFQEIGAKAKRKTVSEWSLKHCTKAP